MPDESCRACGGTLINCTLCAECKEVTGMICKKCGSRTLEQFHGICMYQVENIQTQYEIGMEYETSPKLLSVA
jgi:predicted amidophosphoribosyltransferase